VDHFSNPATSLFLFVIVVKDLWNLGRFFLPFGR
jgi:hypothetical protein